MNAPNPILQVILAAPEKNADLLAFSKTVNVALMNNARFPSPTPTLAVFSADIAAFDQAETAVESKAPGAVVQRNEKKAKVLQDLRLIRGYVQGVVETLTSDTLSAVESTGLRVKKHTLAHKQALACKDGATTGFVEIVAKAVGAVATYFWQYSLDGKTWTSAPETMKATTSIGGLTSGQSYSFRLRTLPRAGAGDYSQVVTHIVK